MPTYEYACTECGQHVEVVQSMSDAPLTTCAVCGGRLRKVFAPIGIVFKGSGFYRTDSRAKAGAAAGGKDAEGKGKDSKASKDAKPAASDGGSSASSSSDGGSSPASTSKKPAGKSA
jgi:putative FmdB family regulatory protein